MTGRRVRLVAKKADPFACCELLDSRQRLLLVREKGIVGRPVVLPCGPELPHDLRGRAEIPLVDIRDVPAAAGFSEWGLGQARLSTRWPPPNIDKDFDSRSLHRRQYHLGGTAFVANRENRGTSARQVNHVADRNPTRVASASNGDRVRAAREMPKRQAPRNDRSSQRQVRTESAPPRQKVAARENRQESRESNRSEQASNDRERSAPERSNRNTEKRENRARRTK